MGCLGSVVIQSEDSSCFVWLARAVNVLIKTWKAYSSESDDRWPQTRRPQPPHTPLYVILPAPTSPSLLPSTLSSLFPHQSLLGFLLCLFPFLLILCPKPLCSTVFPVSLYCRFILRFLSFSLSLYLSPGGFLWDRQNELLLQRESRCHAQSRQQKPSKHMPTVQISLLENTHPGTDLEKYSWGGERVAWRFYGVADRKTGR